MILGHGKTTDKELKPLAMMVRREAWGSFIQWCEDYEIEIALAAMRDEGDDIKAYGIAYVLDELKGFAEDVEQRFKQLAQ